MEGTSLQHAQYQRLFEIGRHRADYSLLITQLKRTLSRPDILNDSFRLANSGAQSFDIELLQRIYGDIAGSSLFPSTFITECLNDHFSALDVLPYQKHDLLRSFFIVMLCPQLYIEGNEQLLLKLSVFLSEMPQKYRQNLVNWLVDIQSDILSRMVLGCQSVLSKQVSRLLPPELGKEDTKVITTNILTISRLLQMLHSSNNLRHRISMEMFHNKTIMECFEPSEQFKLSHNGIKLLNFTLFPFLLDIDYKNKLLQIETRFQHQINMQKGLLAMLNGILPQHLHNGSPVLINALFLMLRVDRNNILDDSLDQLSKTQSSLKNPLKITFNGEPGDDGGGVKKQYFQLLMKEIFHPHRDMFLIKNNSYHWFNGQSYEAPIMFELVGMMLGLSIYNTTLLDLKFPTLVYRKLLTDFKPSVEDLREIEPDYERSFKFILSTEQPLQSLDLTFEAQSQLFGEVQYHPLKPHGNLIRVTQQNKKQYVQLHTQWLVNQSIDRQFKALKKGFFKVVTGNVIKLFTAQELQRVICGSQTLDFAELQKAAKYESFTEDTPVVRWLWEILKNYNEQKKKDFLFFVTGTDRAPIGGLKNCKFIVQRQCGDGDVLPTARTCSSVLLLPQYSSKDKLFEKLELVLQYKQGFGLI